MKTTTLFTLIVILFFLPDIAFTQVTIHTKNFFLSESPSYKNIEMGGLLDGENTFTGSYGLQMERIFEPMVLLRLTNIGDKKVYSPRIVINNERQWFDFESLIDELFSGISNDKEKALSIWKHFRDNRVHHRSPETGCNISDPIKALGLYGYMTCGPASTLITSIGNNLGYDARAWHMQASGNRRHAVPEIKFSDRFIILDIDAQVFYLDFDNQTLVGRSEIKEDNFLIRRTHHFGKSIFNDKNIADLYNGNNILVGAGNCWGHSLDITLRPGESIMYDWSEASLFHHLLTPVPTSTPWTVANSRIVYSPPFATVSLEELVDTFQNVQITNNPGSSPTIHAHSLNEKSFFEIKTDCPFTLLNGKIKFSGSQATPLDTIQLEYSENGASWEELWVSSTTGSFEDSVSIYDKIKPMSSSEKHVYYIRFNFFPKDSVTACGIDSLEIKTIFQSSRFFMPRMRLGENLIEYTDINSGNREVELEVIWRESVENNPPEAILIPLFPEDGGETESTQFTFTWNAPTDPEGDEIIDYEFQLSNRDDMRFPLSPNFEIYSSIYQNPVSPEFNVPWPGLLNDGKTYYWKVRAKDERGAWSDWSPVWSFTAHGVMMPVDGQVVVNNNEPFLKWQPNPAGYLPAFYEVHGSEEPYGFTPDSSTLVGISFETQFNISGFSYDYYRVIAADNQGEISGPSRLIVPAATTLPQPPIEVPTAYALMQNYPNPFNSGTLIEFSLPQPEHVTIDIFDLNGRKVNRIVDEYFDPGVHNVRWNGEDQGENITASGVYFYVIKAGSFFQTRKMIKLR